MGLKFNSLGRKKYLLIVAAVAVLTVGAGITRALLLGGTSSLSSSSDIDLQKGLVGWWKFDDNAKDATPYANNGTLVGGPTGAPDRHNAANSAMSFNGTSQYISLPASGLPTSAITVSLWVNQSTLVNYYDLAANSWTAEGSWDLYTLGNGQVLFGVYHSSTQYNSACNTGSMTANSWHHLVGTYDGSTVKVYFDGSVCSTTKSVSGVTLHNTGNWTVGEHAAGSSTHSIDDVRVYNRALSSNEVSAIYNGYDASLDLDTGENELLGWWKLDGNTLDSTPYANNGSLAGSTVPTSTTDREGASNTAYSFDGTATTGGYIVAPNRSSYAPDVGLARTYSIWMKGGAQSHTGYLFYENGSCIGWYLMANTNGSLTAEATLGNSGCTGPHYYPATTSGTNYLDNKWHLVTGVIDRPNSLISLYIDGALKTTAAVDNNTYSGATSATLRIGTDWNDGNPFAGSLDDARVYGRALSATEVASLYKSYNSQVSLYSTGSSGGSVNLAAGLVGEWDFNGNARDATPYSNNGTVSGATLTTDRNGRANSAYQLGDSGAWIGVGSPSTYSNLSSGFTYNIWLMRTTSSVYHWPEIMGSSNTHVYYGIRSQNFGDSIGLEYATSPYAGSTFASTSGQTLPVNQWHMFTVTYDGTTLKSYWDSLLKSTTTVALNPTFGGLNFTGATNAWNGSIDDARVWSRALSQTEVTALYSVYR